MGDVKVKVRKVFLEGGVKRGWTWENRAPVPMVYMSGSFDPINTVRCNML